MRTKLALGALLTLAVTLPDPVFAAGYDTPILYSARHMGMGGAAIGYVNDPSALFHNPAGLARTGAGAAMADFSPLIGWIWASPEKPNQDVQSKMTFAPMFLAGGSYRVHDRVWLGLGVYPVASAGGAFEYDADGSHFVDSTKLVFIEASPGLGFKILDNLSLGASWRFANVSFRREKNMIKDGSTTKQLDLDLKANNFSGFRVGLQWAPVDGVDIGLVYRSKTETVTKADTGTIVVPVVDPSLKFVLPSKFGLGINYRILPALRAALDVEYTLQSENGRNSVEAKLQSDGKTPFGLANVSDWSDNVTIRGGLGYYVTPSVEARAGYLFDGRASNTLYPSAFGTPPGPTHTATLGAGFAVNESLTLGFAAAARMGSADVQGDKGDGKLPTDCAACGKAGEYKIALYGAYVDAVWRFGK